MGQMSLDLSVITVLRSVAPVCRRFSFLNRGFRVLKHRILVLKLRQPPAVASLVAEPSRELSVVFNFPSYDAYFI